MSQFDPECELCRQAGGEILWTSPVCRVISVDNPAYPGFCRVVWTNHVQEMTDLPAAARNELMRVVFAVEAVIRRLYAPKKINLASFGNVVPHLHWHVIPRWEDDPHFPEPIWGNIQRPATNTRRPLIDLTALAAAVSHELETFER